MEKQSSTINNNYNAASPALGASTSTSSGVEVYDPSLAHDNPPPPPSYDQAIGNTTMTTITTATRNNTYAPTGWTGPGAGAQNTGYAMPTAMPSRTTNYTYGSTIPPPSQQQQYHQQQQQFHQQQHQQQHQQHHQPIYHQQPQQAPPIVIIQQQPILPLGPEPVYLTCPACNIQKLTRIEYEPSSKTHLMAALLCLFGLYCCVCLPYCAGSCMRSHHYCGNCGKFLGTYDNV